MLGVSNYDHRNYPLCRFAIDSIPDELRALIDQLNQRFAIGVRGGLAYVFQTGDIAYQLKDIDLFVRGSEEPALLAYLQQLPMSTDIFINHSLSGNRVITMFCGKGPFYKIDMLQVASIRHCQRLQAVPFKQPLSVASAAYIWNNRLLKIGERHQRQLDDVKTLNHYRVLRALRPYVTAQSLNLFTITSTRIDAACDILKPLLTVEELQTLRAELCDVLPA